MLETFLESEFSSENIRFWIAIQDLKYAPNEQIYQKAERIREEFLAQGAPAQVNVDNRTLDQTLECISKAKDASQMRFAFYHSEEHVFTLMAKDSYPRFVRSQIYKAVLTAAQQHGTKRLGWRNFVFNMGTTKKPATSKPAKARFSRKLCMKTLISSAARFHRDWSSSPKTAIVRLAASSTGSWGQVSCGNMSEKSIKMGQSYHTNN